MAIRNGLGIELEEMGMVALAAVVVLPGIMWVANASSAGSRVWRGGVVAALLAGMVALEISMDKTANAVAESLD